MIGNDVVDLALARQESNWQRRGFLAKLFTPSEQKLIHEADEPERMVWLLWSMKESAYKSEVRLTGVRRFAPLRLSCSLTAYTAQSAEGRVSGDYFHETTSSLTVDFVATVAKNTPPQPERRNALPVREGLKKSRIRSSTLTGRAFRRSGWGGVFSGRHTIFPLSDNTVQQQLFQDIHQETGISPKAISLQKNKQGVPSLLLTDSYGESAKLSVSLSHHGRFGAYALHDPVDMLPAMHAQNHTAGLYLPNGTD